MEGMSFDVKCVTSCDVSGTLMIKKYLGTSLRVQWLGFHTSNTAGVGSVPGLGAEIPSVVCREHTHTHTHTHTQIHTYVRAWSPNHFSHLHRFATLRAVAHQAPLPKGFSRQEDWSGLPRRPPGDLPDSGIEPRSLMSPALTDGFFTTSATWEAHIHMYVYTYVCMCVYIHIHIYIYIYASLVVAQW